MHDSRGHAKGPPERPRRLGRPASVGVGGGEVLDTPAHAYDVLVALNLLCARGTADSGRDAMAKGREQEFRDSLRAKAEGCAERSPRSRAKSTTTVSRRKALICQTSQARYHCVAKLGKGKMNRKLMAQLFGTNYRLLQT